jgi:hypothetical protein
MEERTDENGIRIREEKVSTHSTGSVHDGSEQSKQNRESKTQNNVSSHADTNQGRSKVVNLFGENQTHHGESQTHFWSKEGKLRLRLRPLVFDEAHFPSRFHRFVRTDVPENCRPHLKRWLQKWDDQKPAKGLYIFGPVEISEVCFAVAVKEILTMRHMVRVISALDIVRFVIKNEFYSEYQAIDELCRPSLLAIYNFGQETKDNFGIRNDVFSHVINRRRDDQKSILVSTNLYPGNLLDNYSPPLVNALSRSVDGLEVTSQ